MPEWWEQDKAADPNEWWSGDSPIKAESTTAVLEDPNEAYKKGVEVQDMAVDLESPLETIETNYDNLTEKPKKIIPGTILPSGVGEPSELKAAPERTKWQKFKNFFVGQRPPLPPNADRIEKLTRAFDIGITGPMRTFLKFSKGMTFNAPDLMWAAIKRITPEDMWDEEVRNMTLDEAMDWAGGYNPSGFQKSVGEIAEFVGRIKTVAPIAQKLGVIGGTPKDISILGKAFETAKLFGTAAVVEQVTKGASDIIEPTEAEYGYEGPKAVLRDMALGAIFSLVSQGVKGLWSKLTPSEYTRALKLLGLKKGATQEEITKAANSLARQYHPDKAKGLVDDFKQVIKARDLLRQGEVKDIVYRGQKLVLKPKILPGETAVTEAITAPQPPSKAIAKPKAVEIPTVTPAIKAQPVAKAEPAKIEPVPLKKPVTVSGKEYHPQTIPVESIGVDPKRFQFKLGAKLAGGVTEALKAVEKYDPVKAGEVLVWQDKGGKYWVIDGHHRVALARKTGQETMDAWVVREEDGWTEAAARATGALRNLADGKGTAVDAAKLFRDSNITLEQLRKEGVPTNNVIVQQGMEMKGLSDEVFRLVVDERLPANMAAAIGREVKGPTQQKQVADLILEGEIETVRQAEFLAMTIDTAPVLTKQEQTLFGVETTEKSLYAERAKILANVEKKLKTNRKVFGTLATQSGLIESKGNILDRIANMETKEMAEEVLYMLDKFANAKGEVAEALNEATKEYAKYPTKDNLTKITNDLVQRWTEATTGLTLQNIKGLFGVPAKGAEPEVVEAVPKAKAEKVEIHLSAGDVNSLRRSWDFKDLESFPEPVRKFIERIETHRGKELTRATGRAWKGKVAGEDIDAILEWAKSEKQAELKLAEREGDTEAVKKKIQLIYNRWIDIFSKAKPEEPPQIKGMAGKLDITLLQDAFTAFMNIIEPSKAVEIKLGKEVYATVIKGVHKADVARIEFNEEQIENMDRSLREFGEALAKYPNKVLKDLMLARGKPHSPGAIELRDQALKDLAKEAPELVGTRKTITNIADFNYKYLTDVVGDDIHYVEDYFYGIYKDPKKVERFIQYWKTTKRFTKEKKLPTVADAVDYGLALRDYNPVNNLMAEYTAIARLDGMIEMRDALMRTGEDKYISKDPEKIADSDKIAEPVFKGLWLDADLARMIKKLISTNKVQRYPILNGLRIANNILRSIKFTFSMFHHLAEAKQSVADSGYLGFVHKKTAIRGITLGFKKGDPRFKTEKYKKYIAHGGGHRYSIDSEAQRVFSQAINKLTKSSQLIIKGLTSPLRIPETYIRWLFESYIPEVKYAKYLDTVNEKEKKLGRELTSPETIDIIKEQQNFYGMMNERLFGRSGTMTTLLRFKFMAPGFAEGNFRSILKAILQWGQEGSFVAGRSRANIINSFIVTSIAATIGTLILTGKLPEKPKEAGDIRDMFKVDTGKLDIKGRKIMIDLMSYDKDYWTIFGKPLVGQAGEVPGDVIRRIGGMTATTWDVMSDLNQMAMGKAIYDWKGNRVVEVTDPFAQRVLNLIIFETSKVEPISFNIYGQSRDRGFDRLTAAVTTLLGARPTTSEKDKRESAIISSIFSLRDRQERLYYYLGSIKEPRKHIDKYNKIAQSILDNPVTTQEIKDKWGKNIIIDTDRLMANKVHAYELAKVTEKPEPEEIKKLKKWLDNFDISESQYRSHLITYEFKHRKLIMEMKASDADELVKNEIAKFYADKGILARKVTAGTATDTEKRESRKYEKISSNISQVGTLIHKTEDVSKRKRYYERIRNLIERSE